MNLRLPRHLTYAEIHAIEQDARRIRAEALAQIFRGALRGLLNLAARATAPAGKGPSAAAPARPAA